MGENAVWQDPEGEVRKWQRDTGTAAWGDPEKQQSLFSFMLGRKCAFSHDQLFEVKKCLVEYCYFYRGNQTMVGSGRKRI